MCLAPKESATRYIIEDVAKPISIPTTEHESLFTDGVHISDGNGCSFEIEGGRPNNGTSIVMYGNADKENQTFYFSEVGGYSGIYRIKAGDFYLNAYGGAKKSAPIKLWNGGDINSQWILEKGDDGKYLIVSAADESFAIGISNDKTASGNTTLCLVPKESATRFAIGDYYSIPTGATLSTGNWWIIIAGAVVIVGGIVTIIVFNKKKKKKTK